MKVLAGTTPDFLARGCPDGGDKRPIPEVGKASDVIAAHVSLDTPFGYVSSIRSFPYVVTFRADSSLYSLTMIMFLAALKTAVSFRPLARGSESELLPKVLRLCCQQCTFLSGQY
jgi:hypothetical protein